MTQHWEDRVTSAQYRAIEEATDKLQEGELSGDDAYEILTQNGLTEEEALEMIQMLTGEG